MKRRKTKTQIWVSPPFKKMLKSEAAIKGIDVISYTDQLVKRKNSNLREKKINNFWSKLI